nr:MAG TPA: hypothetical protein [Caudoviricetes sp.]
MWPALYPRGQRAWPNYHCLLERNFQCARQACPHGLAYLSKNSNESKT